MTYAGEDEENSVCGNSGRHKGFSGQRLRMRKAGSCKAQILETRVDFLETRSELFQNWVVWTKGKLLVKLKEILWTGFIATQKLRFLAIT